MDNDRKQRLTAIRADQQKQIQMGFLREHGLQAKGPAEDVSSDELEAIYKAKRREFGLTETQKPISPVKAAKGALAATRIRKEAARRSRGGTHTTRRRRALHALRALPNRLATDPRFTDAFFSVLELHYRMADDEGCWTPSIPEITNRLKLSRSTVIRAHKLLEEEGLLIIERRRIRADRNDTNVYRLGDELLKGRPRVSEVGVRDDTAKVDSLSAISTTPEDHDNSKGVSVPEAAPLTRDSSSVAVGDHDSTLSPRREPSRRSDTARPTSDAGLRLARVANRLIDPDEPEKPSVDYLLERAEELRAEYMPRLFEPLWRLGLRKHGWNATLAVFETVLLVQTGYVHSPHGFLWGILNKHPAEANPQVSLSKFMSARRRRQIADDLKAGIAEGVEPGTGEC